MSINDIKNMPIQERMQLMEVLLDSFSYDEEIIASPSWHKEVLENRREILASEEVKTYSLDELKALR
jgi:hypothetical protein